jgi:outer membrane protein TolC
LRTFILLFCVQLAALAQVPPPTADRTPGAVPLPLSGRGTQLGGVGTARTTNPGGLPTSANTSINTVQVQGVYSGSVPQGTATAEPLALSLSEAIRRGLQYNLATTGYTNATRVAEAQKMMARSALLPTASMHLLGDEQQSDLAAFGFGGFPGFPAVVGPFHFFDLRAGVAMNALNFPSLHNNRAAAANLRATRLAAKDARDLIVLAVSGTYLQVIAAGSRVASAKAQVNAGDAVYQQAVDRNKAGVNARIDVLRSQVELLVQQQRLRSLEADLAKQKLNLGRLIGLPPGQDFNMTDAAPYAPLEGLDVAQALERAYKNRSDLQAAQAQVQAAEHARQAAVAERMPSVGVSADYGVIGVAPNNSHGTFTMSADLHVPVFDGGRIRGDIDQASAVLDQRKAELADLRGHIDYDVRSAFVDLQAAVDQVRVSRSSVDLAAETLTQARDRFAAGVADTIEAVQAEESVAASNEDYISSLYSYNLAKVTLARAMGVAEESMKQLFPEK